MNKLSFLTPTPWDSIAFHLNTFEINDYSREALSEASETTGHYTVKINPLISKDLLHEFGFYYCDTLIEPFCLCQDFSPFENSAVSIRKDMELKPLLNICNSAFVHGRFHRDFNLERPNADSRYKSWLAQLHEAQNVYGLFYNSALAGFMALDGCKLVLHAVSDDMRGKGIAKYLWTPICKMLFEAGHEEIYSSVSASNLAVVNLYARLGFKFRNPVDVYHKLTR